MTLARDFWGILTPKQRRWVVAAHVASVLMALSTLAGVVSIAPFFAVLGEPRLIDRSPPLLWLLSFLGIHNRDSVLAALGVGFVGVVVFTNLVNLLGAYALLRLSLWLGAELRTRLFAEYLRRDFPFHARTNSTTLFNNVLRETNRVAVGILQSAFVLVTGLITAAAIIVSIVLVNPVAATAVVAGLSGGYFLIYLAVQQRALCAGRIETELLEQMTQLIFEGFGAIKEIIVLRRQHFFLRRFERSSRAMSRVAAYISAITQSPKYLMECIAVGGLVGTALVLNHADSGIGRSLAQLTFLGFAIYRLLPALQQAFAAVVQIRGSQPGFEAIVSDLRRARSARIEPMTPDPAWRERPRREIEIENVSFRYSAQMPPALQKVSLRVPAGAIVGLIGSNGSGKTTLVDVLAGLLVPDSGQVRIDGIALDEGTRPLWRSRIAYMPQSVFLLDATIAENIALATDPGEIDRERMIRAARLAGLDEFVAALPDKYEERVGERGVRLSGGQRQRVGIARALYTETSILIMDEATSSLDALAEAHVMATVEALRGNRTVFLIAHRTNTLRQCDLIFELEKGTLVRQTCPQRLIPQVARIRANANSVDHRSDV